MADTQTEMRTTCQEKTADLLETIKKGVEALKTDEDWLAYLRMQTKFHRYSFGNVLLICCARPAATYVAGFQRWRTLGRHVVKGEKGIPILAPLIAKRKKGDDAPGGADEQRKLVGFRREYVFDVSQTDGAPLPVDRAIPILTTEGPRAFAAFEMLKQYAEGTLRIPVTLEAIPGGAKGFIVMSAAPRIVVSEDLPPLHQAKTLAHELGHAVLHLASGAFHDKGAKEVEAESVAYCVMNALGFDSGDYSFPYVASWSDGDPEQVTRSGDNVKRAVAKILDAVLKPVDQGNSAAADADEPAGPQAGNLAATPLVPSHDAQTSARAAA